nr:AraC family transcriptional regulator [Pseudomonas sp. FFPRI_1]
MPSLGFTSLPPLLKYLLYAEQLGIATAPALAAAGIEPEQLNDTSLRLPMEVHERLLDYFCLHSGDPLFGLNSARFVKPSSWNVLGYITMNCATLGEAMGRIMPFEKLVGDMGTSRAELLEGEVRLIWSCRHQRPDIRRHLVENVLASWLLYARWIADSAMSPRAVWFEHPLPQNTQVAQYEALFGCPVLFQQPCSALVAPLEYLQLPLRQADARLLRTLEDHAQTMMASLADAPLALQVHNVLRQLLKDGLPRKEQVAEHLSLSVRTLQRQLQQAGTSYQQILDDLRQELAEHHLRHSELSIQGISDCLGFTEPRSFHRSFKSRTGLTPGQFRQAAQASGKA